MAAVEAGAAGAIDAKGRIEAHSIDFLSGDFLSGDLQSGRGIKGGGRLSN
jgi:hypothetical protein